MSTSLVAAVVYAVLALLAKAIAQYHRAEPFTGTYEMFDVEGSTRRGGTVRIERTNWKADLVSFQPNLTVSAEHGTGHDPGTTDWTATVEVLGLSKTASGYYSYPNEDGGALRLVLSNDDEIIEYGTPFNPQYRPFRLVLKRKKRRVGQL